MQTIFNHSRKGSQLGLTTCQQSWSKQVEKTYKITALTPICNRIWQMGEWPSPWTQSLVITLPRKGNLQQCQNYRTISLISHPNKVTLKIIPSRLKPLTEKIIAEEQEGVRAGRSTTEHCFNLRILCEKYLQHEQDLFHVFKDCKKAFDRFGMQLRS